jgi:hypothetical protein
MERREHPRRGFWLPVSADGIPGGVAVSHNASDNGLLIVCPAPPELGARLALRFRVPPDGGAEVSVSGRVVRVTPNDEDPDGLWPWKAGLELERTVPELHGYLQTLGDSPAH